MELLGNCDSFEIVDDSDDFKLISFRNGTSFVKFQKKNSFFWGEEHPDYSGVQDRHKRDWKQKFITHASIMKYLNEGSCKRIMPSYVNGRYWKKEDIDFSHDVICFWDKLIFKDDLETVIKHYDIDTDNLFVGCGADRQFYPYKEFDYYNHFRAYQTFTLEDIKARHVSLINKFKTSFGSRTSNRKASSAGYSTLAEFNYQRELV